MTTLTFITGLADVAERFDTFMISPEGVLHDEAHPLPFAVDTMTRLTAEKKAVVVLTNSPDRAAANMARLEAIGFPRSSYTALVSSGEVIWHGLRTGAFGPPFEAGSRVHVVGSFGEDHGLDGLGLTLVERPDAADFLLIAGSAPEISLDQYNILLRPAAAQHVPALCIDVGSPVLRSSPARPSAGAIAELYEQMGGRITHMGRPYTAIYRAASKLAGTHTGQVLCIGSSLDRDIVGGEMAGFKTALVHAGADHNGGALNDMLAEAKHRPTYVLPGFRWS